MFTQEKQRILDQRWLAFCAQQDEQPTLLLAETPTITGEKWYILASQCGEWIFNGLLTGAHKEYVVLLCAIFRLLTSPVITNSVIKTLANLERRFQAVHRQLLPPIAAPLQFHRIGHIIQSCQMFGPVFIYWTFRSERVMGQTVRKLPRRVEVEACLEGVILRGLLARHKQGTITMAEDALYACQGVAIVGKEEGFEDRESESSEPPIPKRRRGRPLLTLSREEHLSRLAVNMLKRRERLGYRLNLVKYPNGAPLVKQAPWRLKREERLAVRYANILFAISCRKHRCYWNMRHFGWQKKRRIVKEKFFLTLCVTGKDLLVRMASSTQLDEINQPALLLYKMTRDVPRFLKVTVFEMHQKGILGESVTIIRPPVRPVYKWVRLDSVVCSIVAFRQPVNNTATLHESYRVAIPMLSFS
eukprot:g34164.t1